MKYHPARNYDCRTAATLRLFSVASAACFCSVTSSASAFTFGLASLSSPISRFTSRIKSQFHVTNYSYEEQKEYRQEIGHFDNAQAEGEESSLQHAFNNWDNDESWFPVTNSVIEDFVRRRQMTSEEGQAISNSRHAVATSSITSTEKLLDSPKPIPIDAVTNQDIEENFLRMVSNEVEYKKFLGQSPYALTDIRFEVLLQRFLDNIEDGTQKNNGKFKGQSKWKGEDQPREERKTVVVLGTGWASHAFVKLASTYDLRIVVVSPVNHFVFT